MIMTEASRTIDTLGTQKKLAWMRVLAVTFTSRTLKKTITFGVNHELGKDDLSIKVDGYKYMSTLKDACTIKIDNLTYSEIVQLIQGQFYEVDIKAGYKHGNVMTIFKGGVLYISNALNDRKTHTAIILCASNLVARFGQKRINLSLNSGINLYSAINFVCRRAGIPNTNVSTQFKKKFLAEIMNVNDTAGSWIDKLCSQNQSYISNSDSITDSTLSIFDAVKSNNRIITLDSKTIDLTGGFPRLNTNGLSLTLMPTFAFMCGDVIKIDNSIINIGAQSTAEANKNLGMYLDKDGCYMITEQHYQLENRGPSFSLELTCKARSLISNVSSR